MSKVWNAPLVLYVQPLLYRNCCYILTYPVGISLIGKLDCFLSRWGNNVYKSRSCYNRNPCVGWMHEKSITSWIKNKYWKMREDDRQCTFFTVLPSPWGMHPIISQYDQLQCAQTQWKGREGAVRDRVMVPVRSILQVPELGAFSPLTLNVQPWWGGFTGHRLNCICYYFLNFILL